MTRMIQAGRVSAEDVMGQAETALACGAAREFLQGLDEYGARLLAEGDGGLDPENPTGFAALQVTPETLIDDELPVVVDEDGETMDDLHLTELAIAAWHLWEDAGEVHYTLEELREMAARPEPGFFVFTPDTDAAAGAQVQVEEAVAAHLFDGDLLYGQDGGEVEEKAAQAGRDILRVLLRSLSVAEFAALQEVMGGD